MTTPASGVALTRKNAGPLSKTIADSQAISWPRLSSHLIYLLIMAKNLFA
jgi:hypothetical protein